MVGKHLLFAAVALLYSATVAQAELRITPFSGRNCTEGLALQDVVKHGA